MDVAENLKGFLVSPLLIEISRRLWDTEDDDGDNKSKNDLACNRQTPGHRGNRRSGRNEVHPVVKPAESHVRYNSGENGIKNLLRYHDTHSNKKGFRCDNTTSDRGVT